jgi:uncharacterized membrane protein
MARSLQSSSPSRNWQSENAGQWAVCQLCQQRWPLSELVPLEVIRPRVARLIKHRHPHLSETGFICVSDLNEFRIEYVRQVLEAEVGELSVLEDEVVKSLKEHDPLASNVTAEFETQLTFAEKWADRIAEFGGSWKFITLFGGFLCAWIVLNTLAFVSRPPDPYPFILLNLMLSCLAAIQAPIIMMSQNRLEAKDRLRSENDYKINLKAELEIRHLHEKLDHLLKNQSRRLFEIQQIQLELMKDLAEHSAKRHAPSERS